jgi:hypothetical protein
MNDIPNMPVDNPQGIYFLYVESSSAQVLCMLDKYKHKKRKKVHMCFEEFNSINCDNHLEVFA